MRRKDVVNTTFGVYKALCCGAKILIAEGAIFPDCPKHMTPTRWELIVEKRMWRGPTFSSERSKTSTH
jgi:hypothetical protein